ncbi:hypothetical protein JHK85_003015 [Glycine max]|uniref:pectinesterase n=1 Tax=Glycine max TaxID=3847 RepID=A0A0R0KWN5_SOYBN|nr:hypothetical protein JHK85_003015 [Glycine max]KAG5078797.1 hypothetical protein JHK86_002862 [Glycine max]KAH1058192.1 hypothetical protein GYH30_002650 [Glycine max]
MGISLEALSAATFEKQNLFHSYVIRALNRSHVIGRSTKYIVSFSLPLDVSCCRVLLSHRTSYQNSTVLFSLFSYQVSLDGEQNKSMNVISLYVMKQRIILWEEDAKSLCAKTEQCSACGTKAGFYGTQDTLYDHKGLHYFNNCSIQGSVLFIFGSARSLYENCYLNSTTKKIYLGRAWGDYSRVIFSYTYMDNIVLPKGWSDWGDQKRDSRVYYGEYKCSGPGANLAGSVPWARVLTDEEAKPFIGMQFIERDTWLASP